MAYLLDKLDPSEYYHLMNPNICQTRGGGESTLQGECNNILAIPADLSVKSSPNSCVFTVLMYLSEMNQAYFLWFKEMS